MLSGTATDADGSGFHFVRTALLNLDTGEFYDATTDSLSAARKHNLIFLTDADDSFTHWQLPVTLPAGNYRLFAISKDIDGNELIDTSGRKQWTKRDFSVSTNN